MRMHAHVEQHKVIHINR